MGTARQTLTIGQAARRAGVSAKAVRLYEAEGLLPQAERTEAGYRIFAAEDISILRFIRQARSLGLHLDEIKEILALQRQGGQPCGKVIDLLESHIRQIDTTIADLTSLREALAQARDSASEAKGSGQQAVVCCIIESQPQQS